MNRQSSLTAAIIFVGFGAATLRADTWVTGVNQNGDWTMSAYKWGLTSPCYPDNGHCVMPEVPEFRWHVTIASGVSLNVSVTLTELEFATNHSIFAPVATSNSLVVEELFTWPTGSIDTNGPVDSLGMLFITDGWLGAGTTLTNHNVALQDGLMRLEGEVLNPIGSTWTIATATENGGFNGFSGGTFHNAGLLRKTGPFTADIVMPFDNIVTGEVLVEEGVFSVQEPFDCDGEIDTLPAGVFELAREGTFQATSMVQGDGTIRIAPSSINYLVDVYGTWDVAGTTELARGVVNFIAPCTTNDLTLCMANLTGDVHVNGYFDWTQGTMYGPGTTYMNGDGIIRGSVTCGAPDQFQRRLSDRTLQLAALSKLTIDAHGPRGENGAVIAIPAGAELEFVTPNDFRVMPAAALDATIENDGLFVVSGPGDMYCSWLINNRGDILIADGGFVAQDSGFIQTAGTTHLGGGTLSCSAGPVDIQGGELTGGGIIGDGLLTDVNSNGIIAPGPGFQVFDMIPGTLALGPSSRLEFDLGYAVSPVPGVDNDAILAQDANIDGELHVTILSYPDPAAEYIVLDAFGDIVGAFTNVASGGDLEEEEGRGVFTVHYGAGSPYPPDQVVVTNFRELCRADINGDGAVNIEDLLSLLAAWGPCPSACSPDVDRDGMVGIFDLLEVLSKWGPCP